MNDTMLTTDDIRQEELNRAVARQVGYTRFHDSSRDNRFEAEKVVRLSRPYGIVTVSLTWGGRVERQVRTLRAEGN